jgi:hypothetical protein
MVMVNRVIEDVEQFKSYLASQPLCQWAAQKQRDVESGKHSGGQKSSVHKPPKSDNSELADALASMA